MSITILLLLFPIQLFRQVLCNILPVARIPFGFFNPLLVSAHCGLTIIIGIFSADNTDMLRVLPVVPGNNLTKRAE